MDIQREIELKPMILTEKPTYPEDCKYRISPSLFNQFFTDRASWYRTAVKNEILFHGNTYTVVGTCVHRIAEVMTKFNISVEEAIERSKQEISMYISNFLGNPEVDMHYAENTWIPTAISLSKYFNIVGLPEYSEVKITTPYRDGIYLSGTIDAIDDKTIIDYKTVLNIKDYNNIPLKYKEQMMIYAYMAKQVGMEIDRIKLIYVTHDRCNRISEKTGKPLKDYPSELHQIVHTITDEDIADIKWKLDLVTDSLLLAEQSPRYTELLFNIRSDIE